MILIQHATGGERILIIVKDKYGDPARNANVRIYENGDKIDSNYTDDSGECAFWLDRNTLYRITAQMNEQFGEWEEVFGGQDSIRIRMH